MVEEGVAAENIVIKEFTATKNSGDKYSWTFTPTTNATIYVHVGNNSNVHICQVEVTDNGSTTLKQGGEIGYTTNLTRCRLADNKTKISMDGIEYNATSNAIKVLTSDNPVKLKNTSEYIKFTLPQTETVSIKASGTYSVTKNNEYQSGSAVSGNQDIVLEAGTYYICPNGSNVTFASLSFLAPPTLYTVEYNLNGATGTTPTETNKAEGAKFNLHDGTTDITAPDGKVFDGWNDGATTYAGGAQYTMPGDNVVFTAQWRTEAVKHSVTYDPNGGTGTTPTQEDIEEGQKFTVASATGITAPEGTRFSTWNDGTNDYAPGADYTMGTSNVTLTAQWENIYAITPLVGIEHGSVSADKATAAEGETVTLTATPASKYVLDAWNVYKTGEPETTVTVTDNKFTMPAYAVTVGATFEADTRKQVLYVTADGTVNSGDDLYAALSEDYGVTLAAYNASQTLTGFDLVVLHESIGGSNAKTGLVKGAMDSNIPVLNTKSYFYNSDRWNWGTPNAGKTVNGCSLNTFYTNIASHPIFEGVTVTNGFVQVVGTAAAKAMQPVGSFVSGKEGYTLATSPNASSGNGTAIHEFTHGESSAKYLLISVSNACLNDLTANGQKLFKNAAAYLMSDEAWTPSVTTTVTLGANGYSTFAGEHNFTVTGATAYTAAASSSKVTLTECAANAVIAAGKGIVLKGTEGAEVTITYSTDEVTVTSTGLEGVISSTTTISENPYVLASNGTKTAFVKAGDYGTVSALMNKAYLNGTALSGSSLDIDFDGATAINNVNANDNANANSAAPVKVIKNGKLYIGNYNVAGQLVK